MGGGGGMFNVAPEAEGKLKVASVCLEHGKKDPNSRVAYTIKPIEFLNSNPKVIELVKMVAKGEIDPQSAQAAAWHLANGLSWEELANKVGVKHLDGSKEAFFSAEQLKRAYVVANVAERRASEAAPAKSKGKEDSLSQTVSSK